MRKFITFLFFLLFLGGNIFAQLSGNYTLNPNSPASASNYQNFESFFSDLTVGIRNDGGPVNGWAVSGPVTLNVADGEYNERLEIPAIQGVSETNMVTIQSESGDSTAVRIFHTVDYNNGNDGVLDLYNTDYIRINQLTLEAVVDSFGTGYSRVIYISGNATHNIISNCIIKGTEVNSTSTNDAVIYMNNSNVRYNLFENNLILNGSYAQYDYYGQNNKFYNNTLRGFYYMGCYQRYVLNSEIIGNTIEYDEYRYSSPYGIYIERTYDTITISGNTITGNFYYGIYFYRVGYYNNREAFVTNNFISLNRNNQNSYGIYHYSSRNVHYLFNTVHNYSTNTGSYSMYQDNYSYLNTNNYFKNNIFTSVNGYAFYAGYPAGIIESDHNNIYSENNNIGYWNGWRNDLASWVSASNQDSNSVSIDPGYRSETDLHINNRILDGAGDTLDLAWVMYDIDGEMRSTPLVDIGADEYDPTTDLKLVSIDSLNSNVCSETNDAYVTIENVGADTVFDFDVQWHINEVSQTTYNWTGELAPDSVISVNIGSFVATEDTTEILANTSNPNGSADIFNTNDSALFTTFKGLGGTYTIGGISPDFSSLAEAVSLLNQRGVCEAVVFNLRDGNYNESITISEVSGVSELNTITFQAESGDSTSVVIHSTSNQVIYMDNCDFVTLQNLTIRQDDNNDYVVRIDGGASNNSILNCVLQSEDYQTTSNNHAIIYSSNSYDNNNNTIANNLFINGSYGIYLGSDNSPASEGTHIANNLFENFYYQGIYLAYHKSPIIENNTILTGEESYDETTGIYLYYCDSNIVVHNNIIQVDYQGVYARYNDSDSDKPLYIVNNFITILDQYVTGYGIHLSYSDYAYVLNNSIHSLKPYNSYGIYTYYGAGNVLKNNNISVKNGYANYVYDVSGVAETNHNNLYSEEGNIGYWAGTHSTISEWKDATGISENSISTMPLFVSETDLHITKSVALNGSGDTIPALFSTDIDGQARNVTMPDIGADEFDFAGTIDVSIMADAEVVPPLCQDTIYIELSLQNLSAITIDSVDVNWTINGVAQTTYELLSPIIPAGDTSFTLGSVVVTTDESYDVKIWTSEPNGGVDDLPENDTISHTLYGALAGGTYTVGGVSPDFATITEAANHLSYGGLCGNDVTISVRDGIYNEQVNLVNITDTAGVQSLVVIESESGDSSAVILQYESTDPTMVHTLTVQGTDNIEIRGITVEALGEGAMARAIYVNEVNDFVFENNQILAPEKSLYDEHDEQAAFYFGGGVKDTISILNNMFYGGYKNLYYTGNNDEGIRIEGNSFSNSLFGLEIRYTASLIVDGNDINAQYIGSYIYDCDPEFTFTNNKIYLNDTYTDDVSVGVFVTSVNSNPATNGLIANNIITGDANEDFIGLYLNSTSYQNIYFNSVRNTSMDYAPLHISSSNNLDFLNNIFANTGQGTALNTNSTFTSEIDTSDYNNWYSNGNYLISDNGNSYPTVTNWYFHVPGHDSNSFGINPYFGSADRLETTNSELNDVGISLAAITSDYDGVTRGVNPDPGALEFDVLATDAGIIEIFSDEAIICDGSYAMYAVIRNFGADTLESATVNWSVNSVSQTAANWTGSLAIGENDTVSLGNYDLIISGNYADLTVEVATSAPNAGSDQNTSNDAFAIETRSGINGEYIIGSSGSADFISFSEAVEFLHDASGICGEVIFNVEDGTYEEFLLFSELAGTDSINRVIFQSISGDPNSVLLVDDGNSSENAVIYFDGTDYITFSNITIEQTYEYDYVVYGENGNSNITFDGCNLILAGSEDYIVYLGDESYMEENIVFTNNYFIGGEYAVYIYGWNNNEIFDKGFVSENNVFVDQYYQALYLEYLQSVIINNNEFHTSNSVDDDYYGIYYYNDDYAGKFEIRDNVFMLHQAWAALEIDNVQGFADNPNIIANNYIYIRNTLEDIEALYLYELSNVNVINNTINAESSYETIGIYTDYVFNGRVVNNIIVANGGDSKALYYDYPEYGIVQSDYNNLYSSSGVLAYSDNNGALGSLTAWQNATNFDMHSLSVDPMFDADTSFYTCLVDLDNAGIATDQVTEDILGNLRNSSTPDIGVLEFTSAVAVELGANQAICPDEVIELDAGESEGAYLWSTGATTRTIEVIQPGFYQVTITTACGSNSDNITISESTDTASASFTYNISNQFVTFENQSTNATSYAWDFGDGNTSSDIHPFNQYASSGLYSVQLIADNNCVADTAYAELDLVISSTNNYLSDDAINVYPIPAHDVLNIELNEETINVLELRVIDYVGSEIYTSYNNKELYQSIQIDISSFSRGLYFVLLKTDKGETRYPVLFE
jgi:hypothetical protein